MVKQAGRETGRQADKWACGRPAGRQAGITKRVAIFPVCERA
jgi:hypothetical protein